MPAPLAPGEAARPPACSTCAAPYTFESRTTCGFCGAPLERPELGEHGAQLARLRDAPATADARARPPVLALPPTGFALVVVAIGAWVVYFPLWRLRYMWFFFSDHWPWGLLGLVPCVAVVAVAAIFGRRRLGPRLARRRTELAVIVRTREDEWMAVNDRPVVDHFVTIAGPGGGRLELRAMPEVARAVGAGQVGVAHLRGEWLAAWSPLA
jgi:hypothetical protein